MNNRQIPKVGIALLAYNQGDFIDAAIQSLKEQTFQDFEIYLIDDGSSDGSTPQKLASISYDKITKKCLHKENRGSPYRRKQYYSILKNQYIINFCGDDYLAPDFLKETVNFLEKNSKYGAVGTNIKLFDHSPDDAYFTASYDPSKLTLKDFLSRNRILGSSLIRRQAILETDLSGGFTRYQDWDSWISMLEKGWKIGLVEKPLFYYRQNPNSLSHTAKTDDELETRRLLLKKHTVNYQKYYSDVILDMERSFLELMEGKNWLEGQYRSLTKENERLTTENETLQNASLLKHLYHRITKSRQITQ